MARRKIVFVIVEGPSDDDALGLLLEKLYDKSRVYVHITRGDITTRRDTDPAKILERIVDEVKTFARSNHFQNIHFQEIVHILDMDGAYIPDNAVIEDKTAGKPVYTLTEIRTKDVKSICARNEKKRKCLERISTTLTVWNIPYQAYYMSCNLDHVLHNKQNPCDAEKETDANAFARRYKNDIPGFVRFLCTSNFSVTGNYVESWNFIKQGLHSLERYSNFGICLQKILESAEQKDVTETKQPSQRNGS